MKFGVNLCLAGNSAIREEKKLRIYINATCIHFDLQENAFLFVVSGNMFDIAKFYLKPI